MPHKVVIELTEKDMDTNLKTQNRYIIEHTIQYNSH